MDRFACSRGPPGGIQDRFIDEDGTVPAASGKNRWLRGREWKGPFRVEYVVRTLCVLVIKMSESAEQIILELEAKGRGSGALGI